MLRLIGRRKAQRSLGATGDVALMAISLPSDSRIHSIRFRGGLLPNLEGQELPADEVTTYALEAWMLPIDDPDAAADIDDVWDTLVPKDTDVQTLDLDAETADSSVFYEPGETDWSAVFDVGIRPHRLWHHHRDISINNTLGIKFIDSQTPFEPKWQPGAEFSFTRNKPLFISQPSILVIGIGLPAGDDTVSVVELPLQENEWPRVKYLGDVMLLALQEVLGLTEATAETPFEEAADLIQRHLDPDVMEETGGFFTATAVKMYGEMTVDHSVVGSMDMQTVTTGR